MARLVNPGTGEILDRLSILSLKILHAPDAIHFRNERNALLSQLRASNGFQAWFEEYSQLGAVNAALWHAEDEMREYRQSDEADARWFDDKQVAHCAFRIQELNDQRSRLIAAINQKTGEHYGEEKVSG